MSSLASLPAARSDRGSPSAASAFSPEFNLLLACCAVAKRAGSSPDASSYDLHSCLDVALDWQQVLALAEHHSVTPLIYHALRELPQAVPTATFDQLARLCHHNALRNLRFAAELIRILDCLDAHSIDALPYKGPALAQSVYGDLGLREFSDLDILLRSADVPRAIDALRALGFAPNLHLSAAEQRAYLRSGYEYTLGRPSDENLLEIQWGIVPRFYTVDFDMEGFFERAATAEVAGRLVKSLSPEDLLLALCMHAAKHAWIRLCWLRDIAGVVEAKPLNWDTLLSRAQALGIERILGLSLILASRLLGANVPDAATKTCSRDSRLSQLYDEIAPRIPESQDCTAQSLEYFRLMLRLRERLSDKARFTARLALTPSVGEWSAIRLPALLFPLYRGVRIFRLAARILGSPAGR
jgi:hypothetical protein